MIGRIHFTYCVDEGWIACRDASDPDEPRGVGETKRAALNDLIDICLTGDEHPAIRAALYMLQLIEFESGLIYRRAANGGRVPA